VIPISGLFHVLKLSVSRPVVLSVFTFGFNTRHSA